jgi:hypothetical protein
MTQVGLNRQGLSDCTHEPGSFAAFLIEQDSRPKPAVGFHTAEPVVDYCMT